VAINPADRSFAVRHVCAAYECGAILNPDNLLAQVQGAILMGIGPALREEILFRDGVIQNASFAEYRVPRFADVPTLDIHLLDRPDLPSSGAGETPIIGIAPAIANALAHATGKRPRTMPIRMMAWPAPKNVARKKHAGGANPACRGKGGLINVASVEAHGSFSMKDVEQRACQRLWIVEGPGIEGRAVGGGTRW
jgi:hypothetical protein